ncbi:hypothetical protein ACSBR1_017041 [Camellia fascicularis]
MGKKPPPGQCNKENDSNCCVQGKMYTTYKCSPAISSQTKATLTINSFEKNGDGGGPSECDGKYHSDDLPVVALSTGWYKGGSRCHNNITISANGRSVVAMVVDECDSTMGCDQDHDYQPPCPNNIVDASKAVWKALAVSSQTKASLTINSFQKGGDGGGPSECDGNYHSDDLPVVALSTGWYKGGSRCHNTTTISANGRSVVAMVVDECDSTMGCDQDHDCQPPCPNNIVDASKAAWKALGVPQDNWGNLDIT